MDIVQQIRDYVNCLDESIDELSLHKEGELTKLPSWVHTTRQIFVGHTEDFEGIVLKIKPDSSLSQDIYNVIQIEPNNAIQNILSHTGIAYNGPSLKNLDDNFFDLWGDIRLYRADNPLTPPALDNNLLIGFGKIKGFNNLFSIQKAKEDALEFWNLRKFDKRKIPSYIVEVKNILNRFQAIIKRRSFLERRIHRFMNEPECRNILLPPHKRCFYEHTLYRGTYTRIADFIIEREHGFAPILIELEQPTHKVLTKSGDLTAQANHAREQISEWVMMIDSDAHRNASGEFSFLTGPKERLVIIGRGLENAEQLLNKKFDGVVLWTYDILIAEAKHRLNEAYSSQCRLLGLNHIEPF